ncbi:MAG: nucleotidyltransferase domain-containing protein [Oligoflexia bacterium]|nr:nucleotidyltransferase domain-containing protein [Oligoflexia bacterium]
MRLSSEEVHSIKTVIGNLDSQAKVYLFGSRVRDNLKGGDIDLLVLSDRMDLAQRILALSEIKLRIGDQKIDLLVRKPTDATQDPFIQSVLGEAILL